MAPDPRKQKEPFIEELLRTLVLVGLFAMALSFWKDRWIEFRDLSASDRYNYSLYKKIVYQFRDLVKGIPFAAGHQVSADSYLDEGLVDNAIEEYKKALQFDDRFVKAYVGLTDIYLRRRYYREALELLRKAGPAVANNPEILDLKKRASFEYFVDEAVKVFERGDRVKARQWLEKARALDPNSAHLYYLLAMTFDERQDFYRMEDNLKIALRLAPKFYLARNFLGDVYFGKGDFEGAIQQYRLSLAIKGDDPSVLNNMGLAYMNLERYGSAISCLENALAFDPGSVEIRYNLAAVYRDYGLLDKAASEFIRVIKMKPFYPNVHNDLGDIYRKQGREQEALREYRTTIVNGQKRLYRGPRNPLLLVELAYAYCGIGEYHGAKVLIDEALKMNPHDQKAYLTLANIYRGLNHPDAAIIALNTARQLSPRNYLFIDEVIADIKEQFSHSMR